ncbi:38445693-0f6d-447a-a51d-9fc080058e87 [Thermothielavioides terrestris]|uniref:38445693-0f6d-447a-a51d-9fc080058e87 n=1 Tax=Thermothielavioides terrestris TaxID=2587410 RepID=A0A446BV58_9PEZI|nr:38445693-0f6d-447a-a51d-9fc080058e87 [Thermothielavioides terrestris]
MSSLSAPPRPAMCPRQASSSSFAEAFDDARRKLDELGVREPGKEEEEEETPSPALSSSSSATDESAPSLVDTESPISPPTPIGAPTTPAAVDPDVVDNFAFAFDIDGVLIRGGQPIPEAIEAMKVLNGENEWGIKVPYIFLTNGGGKSEAERCRDLSQQLQIEVSPGQFICGHTPMRELADRYHTVLVVGGEGEKCREVAESYGFRDVITPGDILKANAATAPFRKLTPDEHANSRDLLARGNGSGRLSDVVIEAVFVFADSRDWASDLQIILDVAQSRGGRLETRSATFDEGPPIYFSHNDVVWSTAHQHARLGMGALRRAVETVFEATTGGRGVLRTHAFGKPQVSTFEFAARLLREWRATRHRQQQHGLPPTTTPTAAAAADAAADVPPATVYFVGDTPESDVRGANAMDAVAPNEWYSILVQTGVYQAGTEPRDKPRAVVGTVLDAVRHGLRREMEKLALARKPVADGHMPAPVEVRCDPLVEV